MVAIDVSQEIDAPLATVWELLIDVARLPEILTGVQAVQVAGGGDFAPGFRWAERRRASGFPAEREWQIIDSSPYAGFTQESFADGERTRITYRLDARGEAATALGLHYERVLEHAPAIVHVAARISDPFHERAVRKTLNDDVRQIAAAAQSTR